jgi:two-component system CheB/CheR fusion protein
MAGKRRGPTRPPAEERKARPPAVPATPAAGAGEQPPAAPFPIVGVGASAGGLEALTQLLQALPVDTGMAFVVVQHLSPTHASMLPEILSRTTGMPVTEVRDEPRVQPNHVYVLPPDRNMVLSEGELHLLPRQEPRGQHRPIDYFLRSLAADQKHRAVGVILSGTATDGTLGLEEIKAEGGITFAQDDTAQQTSMPRSAVASGCVDFVLPPDGIARELGRIARHPYVGLAPPAESAARSKEADLGRILETVRQVTGVDFAEYKVSTLYRRISRRMLLLKLEGMHEYARHLAKDPAEAEALYQDILISVTSFFRNPEMFEKLKARVLPELLRDRSRLQPLRIWVVGCSGGDEVYSLAIACAELGEATGSGVPVQIFATDLSAERIEKARAGVYAKSTVHDVSPERLRRFFVEVEGGYRIARSIRDMCVFARHNVLVDPPFSQMDLISCRNLLIYLEQPLQRRILHLLHYALKPGGRLLLGSSETISAYRGLFEAEDAKLKIYLRRPARPQVTVGQAAALYRHRAALHPGLHRQPAPEVEVQREADRLLLARYVPPGVLVNADLEILQVRGDTGPYLVPAPGKASLNLLKMARVGLLVPLRSAVNRARKTRAVAREEGVRVKSEGGRREVDLEVVPIKGSPEAEAGFLVAFEEPGRRRGAGSSQGRGAAGSAARPRGRAAAAGDDRDQEIERLERELTATREYLQSVIEQQEAANEELQSANEEVQSANEELQSTNEELETSKEEIQSSNEELATVNEELQNSNLELDGLNDDLLNLLASVQMPIVMLGKDLRVRRFTPMAEKLFSLIPSDVGRPIGDINLKLRISDLEHLLTEVIDTVSASEREVQDTAGRWYLLRVRPYRTAEAKIEGAVIVLIDVDKLKRAQEYAESIVAAVRESLLVLNGSLRVQSASRSFYQTFKVTPGETEGRLFFELGNGQWDTPELHRLLEQVLPRAHHFDDFELTHEFAGIGQRTMSLSARRLSHESGASPLSLVAIEDVSARKQLEVALRERVEDLAAADRTKNQFLALLAHELRNPLAPLFNALTLLETPGAGADATQKARDMMSRQVRHMAQLVDDLLDVSRITQGKIHLRKRSVDLNALLAAAVEAMHEPLAARGQELELALPPRPVLVEADPTRMEQVFGNLLNNASKFTPTGGHITVRLELDHDAAAADGEAVVRVADDGIGMDPATLPRVFDLFMQADRSLDRARGGLGIGLTVVHQLVALHGGSAAAHSDGLGKGSELVVRLPLLACQEPAAAPRSAVREGGPERPAGTPAGAVPRRVLVVEDNLDTAESLTMLLRLRGHEVEVAHDGQQALVAAAAFEPEVVLLDIGLPGLDGYQVARNLRRRRGTAKALIVALTGYGQDEDQRRAHEAGFDHHLTKPVAPQAIYELLDGPGTTPS